MANEDKLPRVFYLRDENRHPVACVVSVQQDDRIVFALSIRNPRDVYDRKRGREIAFARLTYYAHYALRNAPNTPTKNSCGRKVQVFSVMAGDDAKARVIECIRDNAPETAVAVREAADYWLTNRLDGHVN